MFRELSQWENAREGTAGRQWTFRLRLDAVYRISIIAGITLVLLELSLNVWINHFADEESYKKLATFEDVVERHQLRFKGHPYLNYVNAPGYKRKGTMHDRLGYRGPGFDAQKRPGFFRIAALGGSTTYTEFVDDDDDTYPAQLEKSLKDLGHREVEVINAGVPGYTSWETLANLEFRVLELDPDMIVVYDALNDVHARLVKPQRYKSDNTGYRRQWDTTKSKWYERFATMRVFLRLAGASESPQGVHDLTTRRDTYRYEKTAPISQSQILSQNPPVYFERNLRNMIGIARINGVQIMFATFAYAAGQDDYVNTAYYRQGIAEHNRVIRELGKEYGVPVFDYAAKMPATGCADCWLDGRHVSKKGAALQGKLFARFIHEQGLINVDLAGNGGSEQSLAESRLSPSGSHSI